MSEERRGLFRISDFFNRLLAPFGVRLVRAHVWQETVAAQRFYLANGAIPISGGTQQKLLALAALLRPCRAAGVAKVRVGSAHDGGYVSLDDFAGIDGALSLGISDNADWDLAMAQRGIAVEQYDHTIEAAPGSHALCRFHKQKIVALKSGPGEESLASLLAAEGGRTGSLILKIDIEGDEWDVFAAAAESELAPFAQILCEFHNFASIVDDAWFARAAAVLAKLHRLFAVVHVHGNNASPWTIGGNLPFPDTLEVSYASRARYSFVPGDEMFPTALDAPNKTVHDEIILGRFQYPDP